MKESSVIFIDKNWWKSDGDEIPVIDPPKKKSRLANKYMSVKEVASRLGVGIWGLYDYIGSGLLEAERVGRRYRISEDQLAAYLDRQRKRP